MIAPSAEKLRSTMSLYGAGETSWEGFLFWLYSAYGSMIGT
jgi:hypothetical protein